MNKNYGHIMCTTCLKSVAVLVVVAVAVLVLALVLVVVVAGLEGAAHF